MTKEEKRFLAYINELSPWNLWLPKDLNEPVEEREVHEHIERMLNNIKNTNSIL